MVQAVLPHMRAQKVGLNYIILHPLPVIWVPYRGLFIPAAKYALGVGGQKHLRMEIKGFGN